MLELIIPWSVPILNDEEIYKNNGFVKTKGSIFDVPKPSDELLIKTFNLINTELSIGAIALCKHSNRNEYYQIMDGNNDNKNKIANDFVCNFLNSQITWKNIHKIDKKAVILEMRNEFTGLRWYIGDDIAFRGILEPYSNYRDDF